MRCAIEQGRRSRSHSYSVAYTIPINCTVEIERLRFVLDTDEANC
jgi:hypothetical protein